MIMSMPMSMSMRAVARGSVGMDMAMLVAASIAQRMFMTISVGMAALPCAVDTDVPMLVAMNLAMGVVIAMNMGAGMANAVGMNMPMFAPRSRSIGVLRLMGMTGAAGMNMFMLMSGSIAKGVVMAIAMGVVMRTVFMSMVMLAMVTGVGRYIKQRRLGVVAASTMPEGET
jgi:hypothetical protein